MRICTTSPTGRTCLFGLSALLLFVGCSVDQKGLAQGKVGDAALASSDSNAREAPSSSPLDVAMVRDGEGNPTGGTGGSGGVTGGTGGSNGIDGGGVTLEGGTAGSARGTGGVSGTGGAVGGTGGVPGPASTGTGGMTVPVGSGGGLGGGGSAGTTPPSGQGGATSAAGGRQGSGGRPGVGGAVATGGSSDVDAATGGDNGSGGALASGGVMGSGGASGSGEGGGSTSCTLGAFQAPEVITGLGLDNVDLFGPSISADGKTLYFNITDASSTDHIYVATRTDTGSAFSAASLLAGVSESSASFSSFSSDGCPTISNDGLTLYFYSDRSGGSGGRDLWTVSRSTPEGSFGNPKNLTTLNGTGDDNLQWVSADELTILFSSSRGSSSLSDLYTATRTRNTGDFSAPQSLAGVNGTTSHEDRAAMSSDGRTLYFISDRSGGVGDKDVWVATRATTRDDFAGISNLAAVNSSARDVDVSLSADETELFFASKRSGQFRLYRSVRACQ